MAEDPTKSGAPQGAGADPQSASSGESETKGRTTRNNRGGRNNSNKKGGNSSPNQPRSSKASWENLPYLSGLSSKLMFNNVIGLQTPDLTLLAKHFSGTTDGSYYTIDPTVLPGIAVYDIMPNPGIYDAGSSSAVSEIQLFSQAFYSWVRKANAGKTNYEAPDLFMYLFCVASIHQFIRMVHRAIRLYNVYNSKSRYYAEQLISILGFDYYDLRDHVNEWCTILNSYAYKLTQLYIPAKAITLFEEWNNLFNFVYLDRPTREGQLYVFRPAGYYKYAQKTVSGVTYGYAKAEDYNYAQLMNKTSINSQLSLMFSDLFIREDIGLMSGDLRKALGDANAMICPLIDPSAVAGPVFDEDVMVKLENADIGICSDYNSTYLDTTVGSFSIDQANGKLVFEPAFYFYLPASGSRTTYLENATTNADANMVPCKASVSKFINLRKDEVTDRDIMLATRWKFNLMNMGESGTTGNYFIKDCGTEIILRQAYYINYIVGNTTTLVALFSGSDRVLIAESSGGSNTTHLAPRHFNLMRMLSNWQYAPFCVILVSEVYAYENTKTKVNLADGFKFGGLIGDLDNIHVSSESEIRRLHQAAVSSAWYISTFGNTI